jgi:hypothetical protein
MDEKKLIAEYNNSKNQFDYITKKVEKHFMTLAKKAIANGNLNEAINIMERCPDNVTSCLIADAINHS